MSSFNGRRVSALAGLALAGVLALAACATNASGGGAYGGAGSTTTSASSSSVNLNCASGATVCTKTVKVSGQSKTVLATANGMTLYYFTPDSATAIACTGACAQTWPPLTATGSSVTGTSLPGTLSTLNGPNGEQALYNGHPLYTYANDNAQSDATGEGVLGKWFVATPDLAAAGSGGAPAATPTSAGGYGGY